jgi:hypothetical protein
MRWYKRISWSLAAVVVVVSSVAPAGRAVAQDTPETPFSVQVTPSPLVAQVRVGETRTLELRIRNNGAGSENLKVGMRAFKALEDGNVQLLEESPREIAGWVTFSQPTFTLRSGEWFTENIKITPPKDAGFSYSFAITIGRATQGSPAPGTQQVVGSVAVFALINIDRPGATRAFTVDEFKSEKRSYEFLPANFSLRLRNSGNTIVQPQGNIFIQRSSGGQPISVLPLNPNGSFLLPGTSRELSSAWTEGFPSYQDVKTADNAPSTRKLVWDWSKGQDFRFGKYVAKVVAVYNDGQRDVPIVTEVSFWVIPWKLLLLAGAILALLLVGVWVIVRRLIKVGRRGNAYKSS